jgi:hypothetical protein
MLLSWSKFKSKMMVDVVDGDCEEEKLTYNHQIDCGMGQV